ncbi:MAG: GTP cyclohydrolase [Saprospiraceae bacterium]|nr:GTP cyclohydrolase [Saprospiraceae bacterium]
MLNYLAETTIRTKFGAYREVLFSDGQKDYIAMIQGDVEGAERVLCRIHSSCIYGHYFNSVECDCREQMEAAQQQIQSEGKGIIILLDQEGKGNGHLALMKSITFKRQGLKQAEAYEAAGYPPDARDFRPAAEMLRWLNVGSVRLLTDNPGKMGALTKYGIVVVDA